RSGSRRRTSRSTRASASICSSSTSHPGHGSRRRARSRISPAAATLSTCRSWRSRRVARPRRSGTFRKRWSPSSPDADARAPGRHMWETNFVPDLRTFELKEWKARGAGGSNIMFVLADGTMHAHMSEMPVGTYKKGHRHGADFHVFAVTGEGYSLYWWEGEKE